MKKENYGTLILFVFLFLGVSVFIIVINNSIMNEIESAERQLSQTPEIKVVEKNKQSTSFGLKASLAQDNVRTGMEKAVEQQPVKQQIEKKEVKPIYEMPLSATNLPL